MRIDGYTAENFFVQQSWNELVEAYAGSLYATAWRILGHAADAEDVVQEVFLEAFQRFDSDATGEWSGLLKRMAVFRALDRLRQRRTPDALSDLALASSPDPTENAIASELETRLRAALRDLPERESEVFWLRYFEDFENEQIADAIGISRGAVATALTKARAKLHQILMPQQGGTKHVG